MPFTCPGKLKANQVFAVIHAINRGTVNFRSLTEEDVRHTSEQDAVREGALRAKDPEAFGKKRKRQTDNDAGGDDDDVEKDEPGRCKTQAKDDGIRTRRVRCVTIIMSSFYTQFAPVVLCTIDNILVSPCSG